MKEQISLEDKLLRKSSRQRTPNQLYTEGIIELKKAPKISKEAFNFANKNRSRPKLYEEQDQYISPEDKIKEEEVNQYQKINESNWYSCRLPTETKTIKVQFVLQSNQQVEKKKEEKIVKVVQKINSQSNLLSIFQKVIKDVNDDSQIKASFHGVESNIGNQNAPIKYHRIQLNQQAKRIRVDDSNEGKLIESRIEAGMLKIKHSKLGDSKELINYIVEVQMDWEPLKKQFMMEDETEKNTVQEYKRRIFDSNILSNISIFN